MPQARVLTEAFLRSLLKRPPATEQMHSDIGRRGLAVRHREGGAVVFVVRYGRAGGGGKKLTIGTYPEMSLAQAHEKHAEVMKQIGAGLDPAAEQKAAATKQHAQQERQRAAGAVTARNIIAEWGWHHARRHRKRPREALRLLKVYLGKPLAGKPAHEITKRDLVKIIDRVLARGSPVMANRLRDLFVQVFAFCAARDLIPNSPAAGLLRKPGGAEETRERALDETELHAAWAALSSPKTAISETVRCALKLILVLGQRPGEICHARWQEFDLPARRWTIPASRAKNGKEHTVPLTDLAVEILERLRALGPDRPCVVPSVHSRLKPNEPLSQRALSRALRKSIDKSSGKLFGCATWTPHDLRRTAATMMTTHGIPRLHVSKVLGHADSETTAIYDRSSYWDEKRHALEVWEQTLRDIIAGRTKKIVPLPKRGKAA